MPEYTYRCENCDIQFDIHQHFSDDPLIVCPECSEEALRKIYRPARIMFKGKGFYVTDNRSSSRQNYLNKGNEEGASESDDSNASKNGSGKEDKPAETKKKTESKPAAEKE